MRWKNVKNIMIILLVIINAFLIGDMALTRMSAACLPKGAVKSAENILERNGISVAQGLISKNYETRPAASFSVYTIDYLSESILGERVQYVSDGQNVVAKKDKKVLTFFGNSFDYSTDLKRSEKNGRKILSCLKKKGLFTDGAYFDSDDGLVKMRFDGCRVEGMYLDAYLDEEGELAAVSGIWGIVTRRDETQKVAFVTAVPQLCALLPQGAHIDGIESVYIISGSGQNYTMKAAWQVTADGSAYNVTV